MIQQASPGETQRFQMIPWHLTLKLLQMLALVFWLRDSPIWMWSSHQLRLPPFLKNRHPRHRDFELI
jgi:hypothetical protein